MFRLFFILLTFYLFHSCALPTENSKVLMYIGTSNNNELKGIEYCFFDTVTGELSEAKLAAKLLNPNFLEVDKRARLVYAVGAISGKDGKKRSVVKSFEVDEMSGVLNEVAERTVPGIGPCYVALDAEKENIMVAYYGSGEVSAFGAGTLNHINRLKHHGNGPVESRQKTPHAHSIDVDPQSNFVYSADLGADKLMVYASNSTGLTKVDSVMCHPGAGPRHFDFSPDGKIMAVLNELDCSVSTFEKDSKEVYSKTLQTLTLLPDTFTGFAKAADIHFSTDGKFLYASNRGFNCIGIFKVNGKALEFVEFVTEAINWPRNFSMDPSGNYLLVANRDSDNIVVFKRDKNTGGLTLTDFQTKVEKPICVKFYN